MGVFERAPETGRLHFHALLYVPDGEMIGTITEKQDYSTKQHKMQTTHENDFFAERFGRNDFAELSAGELQHGNTIGYILKYIGKTGEKITYSRGIRGEIWKEIDGNDIACEMRDFVLKYDLYNINADKIILLAVAIAESAIFSDIDLLKAPTGIFLRQLIALLKTRYPSLLRWLGLKSGIKTQALIRKIIIAMYKEDYSALAEREEQEHQQVLSSASDVIFASTKDLRKKIEERSRAAGTAADGERVRDLNLVSLLKAYYMACYSEDDFLKCECCGERTFLTCAGEPYLEFHHLIPFRLANGPDHYLNLFALCPTCHRKLHFMRLSEKQPLYHALGKNNYLHMDFVQRLSILKEQRQLRSYQLEYLYAENAITAEEYENIAG